MKKESDYNASRRKFIQQSGLLIGSGLFAGSLLSNAFAEGLKSHKPKVNAHLWLYASKYPPQWDATPSLEALFADMSYAGIDGVELMESVLRHDDAVKTLNELIKKYNFPVSGSSYGVGMNMWDTDQHQKILDDINVVVPRLSQVGGKTFGISVGEPKGIKTEQQLDAQAVVLKKVLAICKDNGIQPNLHNHTYEVENGMHDLKGTLARIPDAALGPDLNWLIRAGINPIDFINTYGKQIVYLHIRDQYANGTWTEYLGQGVTDFPAIAAALKKQGFKGNAAIELAFPAGFTPVNPLKEDWKMSREYVNKTFGW
ncbi:sugar phosphate isomerase/epimerase family protein [Parasediminibacterium sp. JCM 36343]|uniref:sugar phosphate isomerase/epimerase family protein n=1 Tax=Parasediminibacterium sp. JCM 36343 TaxID=3374279 RepID=UPI00397B2DC0